MPFGNYFPSRRSVPGTFDIYLRYAGGGAAADCVASTADWNTGVESVVYVSTGIYDITFTESGYRLIDWTISVDNATGVDPVVGKVVAGTYSRVTKVVRVEFGATLADLLTTDILRAKFTFSTFPKGAG